MTRLESCTAAATALLTDAGSAPRPLAADDERYHRLRATIESSGAAGAAPPDWAAIEADATALLRDRAPDLLVLAYLAAALHRRRALDGLLTGVLLIRRALAPDAPALTPPPSRARARGLAITWLIDQILVTLRPATPPRNPDDQALLAALQVELRHLRDHTAAALDRHAPSFSDLIRRIDALALPPAATDTAARVDAPPVEAVEAATPSTSTGALPPSVPPPTSPPPRPIADPADSSPTPPDLAPTAPTPPPPPGPHTPRDRHLRAHGDALVALAHHLRGLDLLDPTAYRLHRVGLFLHLDRPPPAREGRTSVGRLAPRDRQRLDDLDLHGRRADLIDAGERLLAAARLDLDLHRRIALALAEHGAHAAAHAIESELRALLIRLPELAHLLDRDGAPLASPDTRAWLGVTATRPTPAAPRVAPSLAAPPSTGPSPSSTQPRDASARPPGDPAIAGHRHHSTDAEADFLRRLALAEARLRVGATEHAVILLRGLLPALDHHDLDRWSPAVAARVLAPLAAALPAGDERQRLCVRLGALAPEALAHLLEAKP